jgi:hypothetical protein
MLAAGETRAMNSLFNLIYATHANGTHHKLALDALRYLEGPQADAWCRVLLKHCELFLEGSKAPDKEFKDFKNHVLHVRDNYWGGAPEKVQSWYAHAVDALREQDWARFAYASGVLSHYYTDPIHPFHTAQSEAENNIHRAAEWSINRAYNTLRRDAELKFGTLKIEVPAGEAWLKELLCQGAEKSNAQYEKLIAHYDVHKGVVDPPAGLDAIAAGLTGELIIYASKGFAVILDRAIAESGAQPPDVNLTLDMVLATLKVPLKWVTKKIEDAETRRLVESMYDELKATGRVEATLPEDDRKVRDLYAEEVLAPRAAAQATARGERTGTTKAPASAKPTKTGTAPPAASAAGATVQTSAKSPVARMITAATAPQAAASAVGETVQSVPKTAPPRSVAITAVAAPGPVASVPLISTRPASAGLSQLSKPPRIYLAATDDVEAAPSIGPKMAERLKAIGVKIVADLLAWDGAGVAAQLNDSRVSAEVIEAWQDQARLVMTVPGLRGTHAQLLTGAGFRTAEALADADAATLSSEILEFAITPAGQRILRDGDTPDLEAIARWIENARTALAA